MRTDYCKRVVNFYVSYGAPYANDVVFVSSKMYLLCCFFLRVPLAHHFGLLYIMSKARNEEESENIQEVLKLVGARIRSLREAKGERNYENLPLNMILTVRSFGAMKMGRICISRPYSKYSPHWTSRLQNSSAKGSIKFLSNGFVLKQEFKKLVNL